MSLLSTVSALAVLGSGTLWTMLWGVLHNQVDEISGYRKDVSRQSNPVSPRVPWTGLNLLFLFSCTSFLVCADLLFELPFRVLPGQTLIADFFFVWGGLALVTAMLAAAQVFRELERPSHIFASIPIRPLTYPILTVSTIIVCYSVAQEVFPFVLHEKVSLVFIGYFYLAAQFAGIVGAIGTWKMLERLSRTQDSLSVDSAWSVPLFLVWWALQFFLFFPRAYA